MKEARLKLIFKSKLDCDNCLHRADSQAKLGISLLKNPLVRL